VIEQTPGAGAQLEILETVRVIVDPVGEQDLIFQCSKAARLRHICERSPTLVLEECDAVAAADEELRIAVPIKVFPEPEVCIFNRVQAELFAAIFKGSIAGVLEELRGSVYSDDQV
jgi:hypothetical protein